MITTSPPPARILGTASIAVSHDVELIRGGRRNHCRERKEIDIDTLEAACIYEILIYRVEDEMRTRVIERR